ncbi:class I SAM-dependent methyltransferase [Candidatus Pacearchaeota archaeon]|nr:class I SAM-dependent methyltransferase [Candidatus Pacearchaeota archaeon]
MTTPIKIISKSEYLKNNEQPNQEEIWDSISELWVNYKKEPFFKVKEFLEGKKGLVIDFGCGCGRNMIKNNSLKYYGVDFSSEQLKAAEKITKEKGVNAKFSKSEADKLDKNIFKDEMFDYGLFIATLHCLETKKQRENSLKEFYRVLKKDAEALISVWNSKDERFKGLKGDIYMSWKKDGKEHMRYYYLYSKDELIDLLKKTGFKILEIYEKEENNDRFSKKNLIIKVKK